MKIIKFKGGLGNQLFQYVFLQLLEMNYGIKNLKADFSYYSKLHNDSVRVPRIEKFNVNLEKANKKELKNVLMFPYFFNPLSNLYRSQIFLEYLFNKKYFFEKTRSYKDVDRLVNYSYFDGYWQSWRYLNLINSNQLRNEISLIKGLSDNSKKYLKEMKKHNSVFIGIRKGDYSESRKAVKHYGIFSSSYYNEGIKYISKKVKNPVFYIFSNDIDWVKRNMTFKGNIKFRDQKDQIIDEEELFLMSSCNHAIIPNSTYYWWAAWLIKNPLKIVIAPKQWFADKKQIDIIPPEWTVL